MKAFIINGAAPGEGETSRLAAAVEDSLAARGWETDIFDVRGKKVGYCTGCDACATKTPGICARNDDGRAIAEGTARSDLMVFVSAIRFGSYSSTAKRAIERTVPLLLPYFLKSRGELHHRFRYAKPPSLLVAGYQEEADEERARIFLKLAERNGVNYLSPSFGSLVVSGPAEASRLAARIGETLDRMGSGPSPTTPMLPLPAPGPGPFVNIRSGPVLLVAAANFPKSNSRAIMDYVAQRVTGKGIQCASLDLQASGLLKGNPESLIEAVRSASRVLIINPLYHDTLSYAATLALEQMAARRADLPAAVPFGAIVHSGYPEPVHTRTAVAVLRRFATEMGWPWMGALTAGATSPIAGEPLEKAGFLTRNLRRGVDIAAVGLAAGGPIPPEAAAVAAKPVLPPALYLGAGNYLMRKKARKIGIRNLEDRPYSRKDVRGD
jgi:multimeric flavodoxin WrbA